MSIDVHRTMRIHPRRVRSAWAGRISDCLLGEPLEVLSFQQGLRGVQEYLRTAGAAPLRNYVPMVEGTVVARAWLRLLPAGSTWTAERAACRTLLTNMAQQFVNGEDAGFDLADRTVAVARRLAS
jgi:hypothetical protein